jgi:hypothetical protein
MSHVFGSVENLREQVRGATSKLNDFLEFTPSSAEVRSQSHNFIAFL